MVTTVYVNIWDETVGALAWDTEQQLGFFEYTPEFLETGWELSPVKMPLSQGRAVFSFPELRSSDRLLENTFKGLPGLIADALPDRYGNQLINTWLAQNGRPTNSLDPIEQLCFIGSRGMGALEFQPATFNSQDRSFSVEMDSLVDTARKLLSDREGFETDLKKPEAQAIKEILKIGTSAGGARPKAVIAYNQDTGQIRSGQAVAPEGFEHWLIKFDGVSDVQFGESNGYGRIEMAYHYMALDCGIEMMESRMLEENGRAHFMTKRFDRGKGKTKFHTQTFCAMQHFDFNDITSFSYEQLFQTMRVLRLPYGQAEQLFRRMVFNVLAQNCDDHTKNFAFRLAKGGKWELSPAYDVCFAFSPESYWVHQHALSVNGKRKNISRNDLINVGRSMNIRHMEDIIDQVLKVTSRWKLYAEKTGVDEHRIRQIEKVLLRV